MKRRLKIATLWALRTCGISAVVLRSRWRQARLAIFCYHGVSVADEHEWDDSLYMRPEVFDRRLRIMKENGFNVLPLDEGVRRLTEGSLPPRSVSLTFDDGGADFLLRAHPILLRYGFPVTVYLTTYYCDVRVPVFNPLVQYVLWKTPAEQVEARPWTGVDEVWNVTTHRGRVTALEHILAFAEQEGMSGREKADLGERLARGLGVDYDRILEHRLFQLLSPDEVSGLARQGVDFQLHTHRHRSATHRQEFLQEIEENRARIRQYAGRDPAHFCYPMGRRRPEYPRWLREAGVRTATTTRMGLAARSFELHQLPRIVDVESMHEQEFESWLSGVRDFFPRRG